MKRSGVSAGFCGGSFLLVLVLSGCAAEKPEPADVRPFVGRQLNVVVPAGFGFADAWELPLIEWSQQTGAEAGLVEYDATGKPTELTQRIRSSFEADSGAETVIFFPATEMALLAADGLLAPLPESALNSGNLDWLDFFNGLREKIAVVGDNAMAVPSACPVLVCYYRADALEAAGLSPPQTWDEYAELVKTIEAWAPDLSAVEPWSEQFRATMFLARATAYAQHPENFSLFFDISTGEPLIDGPGFVRALEEFVAIRGSMPETIAGYSPAECRRELLSGRAAIGIAYETQADRDNDPTTTDGEWPARAAHVRLGCCRLPGSREVYDLSSQSWGQPPGGGINQVTLTGFDGWMAGVASGSSEPASAAWNLLSALAASDVAAVYPEGTRTLCRNSQLPEISSLIGSGLSPGEARNYGTAVAASLNDVRVVAELPMQGRAELRQTLTAGVTQVLEGAAEPQAALHQVAEKWRQTRSQIGSDRLTNSYRLSLGLRERPVFDR